MSPAVVAAFRGLAAAAVVVVVGAVVVLMGAGPGSVVGVMGVAVLLWRMCEGLLDTTLDPTPQRGLVGGRR